MVTHWELLTKHATEIKLMQEQRKEDRMADKIAHDAILEVVKDIRKDVKMLDKRYMTRNEARVWWSIIVFVSWLVWFFIWR